MTLNEAATREVLDVLDTYVRNYNDKNTEKLLSLFSKDISGFGTGDGEVITSFSGLRDQLKQDFGPSNALRVTIRVLSIGGVMPAAWITATFTFEGTLAGKPVNIDGRVTAVLANRGGRWLFEQLHFSLPGQ